MLWLGPIFGSQFTKSFGSPGIKGVNILKFVIVCRFFEFKIILLGRLNVKLSNKSFAKIHFSKNNKFSIKPQALELLVHPKVI